MKRIMFLIFCLHISNSSLFAIMIKKDVKTLTRESDLIVIGKVINIDSQIKEKGQIFTYVSIKVDQYIKGVSERAEILIVVPGGKVGELGMWVSEAPKFIPNQTNLLFLHHFGSNLYRVVGGIQGKLAVDKGKVAKYEMPLSAVLDEVRRELQ